jgi:hypothetical protein
VVRRVEDRRRIPELHHPAEVEHGDLVGQIANDSEIV